MSQENLWAAWRMTYLRELVRKEEDIQRDGNLHVDECFFTTYWNAREDDELNHVVYRNEHGIILLNRYPYTNGHLLVALGDPRPTLLDYEPEQRARFWRLMEIGMELMQHTLSPQGMNAGFNLGRAGGAGVPEHMHAHIVPRWAGDTNFMSAVGGVRVIPDSLETMTTAYRKTAASLDL